VRHIVRAVNALRRSEGLHVSDRIHLVVAVGHHGDVAAAIDAYRSYVERETLAAELVVVTGEPVSDSHRVELADGRAIHIGLRVTG
jgi:hypothetical protein